MDTAPDPEDLKEDLVMDMLQLQADLKMRGIDLGGHIQDFLRDIRGLETDAQIQRLRKQIDRMTKMKNRNAPSNSTSALVSTLAPSSVGAVQMVAINNSCEKIKDASHAPNSSAVQEPSSDGAAQMVAMNNGGAQREVVKRGYDRDSSTNFGSPDAKRARSITGVPIKQHGKYVCLSSIHPQTYETAVNMADFLFEQLLKVPRVHSWKRIPDVWLQNLPYPAGLTCKQLKSYISNGYIKTLNLLKAAWTGNSELIQIGLGRKSRCKSKGAAHGRTRRCRAETGSEEDEATASNAEEDSDAGGGGGVEGGRNESRARPVLRPRRSEQPRPGGDSGQRDESPGREMLRQLCERPPPESPRSKRDFQNALEEFPSESEDIPELPELVELEEKLRGAANLTERRRELNQWYKRHMKAQKAEQIRSNQLRRGRDREIQDASEEIQDARYPYRFFPVETSLFSSSPNSHRFDLPIRQFSFRSDLQYVPTLGTFLSYERSLLRSFGSPQLRRTWSKKRQNFPVEKSKFSSGKGKLFQWKTLTFPAW